LTVREGGNAGLKSPRGLDGLPWRPGGIGRRRQGSERTMREQEVDVVE
jgi:hypothetical protein